MYVYIYTYTFQREEGGERRGGGRRGGGSQLIFLDTTNPWLAPRCSPRHPLPQHVYIYIRSFKWEIETFRR